MAQAVSANVADARVKSSNLKRIFRLHSLVRRARCRLRGQSWLVKVHYGLDAGTPTEAAWAGDGSLELRGEEEGDPSVVARGRGGPQQFGPQAARRHLAGANVV